MTYIFRVENQMSEKPACSKWFTYGLEGAISQKIAAFVTTAVKTSNPTNIKLKKNSMACLQANYTDRATAAFQRS
jgi:hypothetical protein